MTKTPYTRPNIERALDFHHSEGNIGRWYRKGDGYWVDITDSPPAHLRTLREAYIFVLGLGSASKAAKRKAVAVKPRQCFYIPGPTQVDDEGSFIPSLVTEGEPGHAPLRGSGAHASPWHWGRTYEEALRTCAQMNKYTFGLEPEEAMEIVLSSMAAQNERDASGETVPHCRHHLEFRSDCPECVSERRNGR